MLTIECLGAVGEVTGSCHLIRVGKFKVLLDCGMIQGSYKDEKRNRLEFPFDPQDIDAIILSHAHIDHSGRIPLIVKRGFRGPIYVHEATRDLCQIMLKDSAFLNAKDVEWENRKRERKGLELIEPLYTIEDAELSMLQFRTVPYDKPSAIFPGVTVALRDAGHILGSAIVELWLEDAGIEKKVVYSGDLGHANAPILRNPTIIEQADLVLMESTYGDRCHRSWGATHDEFLSVLDEATTGKGNILIPAFAVGRSQLVLYWLAEFFNKYKLNQWHIFLDSPMAIQATRAYAAYSELYDARAREQWRTHQNTSLLPNLHMTESTDESIAINRLRSGAIVIAGSGMCTGGRIKHHLRNNVWRRECHIIIVGYQAYGTVGRALVDRAPAIRLWGETVRVAAKVHTIGGLSAHADQKGLCDWYAGFKVPPEVVLVHGEPPAQKALAAQLRSLSNRPVTIAGSTQVFDLQKPGRAHVT